MEISYEVVEKIGTMGTNSKGWSKEVNLISWNGREPKLDIRDWSEDHSKMGKGITLTKDEATKLVEILNIYLNK